MSKSILVIDTPENCNKCPMLNISDGETIDALCANPTERKRKVIDHYNPIGLARPDWCPIRGLPEKKPRVEYQGNGCFGINEVMKNSFNMGFNSCIDEILKGANGNE